MSSDAANQRTDTTTVCAAHGLRYAPAIHSGCVLCRRDEIRPRPRSSRFVLILSVMAIGAAVGTTAAVLTRPKNQTPVAADTELVPPKGTVAAPVGLAPNGVVSSVPPLRPGIVTDVERARVEMEGQALACSKGSVIDCSKAAKALSTDDLKDDARAAAMLQRGCDLGDPSACMDLAMRQGHGAGVARNEQAALSTDQRAYDLIEKECSARDAGAFVACMSLVAMAKTGQMRLRRAQLAPDTLQRECEANQSASCFELATATGNDKSPWHARGVAILRRECDDGNLQACGSIGSFEREQRSPGANPMNCLAVSGMYEHGEGVARDPARAREFRQIYLEKQRAKCDQGDSQGCMAVGVVLDDREGKPYLQKAAKMMLSQSIDAGR
jgi:TPR repeat protein